MANELLIPYPTGATLYAMLFDSTGQVWNGSAFAAPGSASWTDYDIAMSEVATSTGIYRASMPAAAAGVYAFTVRKQAGGSPAVGDITVGSGKIEWSGTAEVALDGGTVLAADGLDGISTTAPSGVASNFREMVVQLWRRHFKKATMTSSELKTYADDGVTVVTTQVVSDNNTTQTMGAST